MFSVLWNTLFENRYLNTNATSGLTPRYIPRNHQYSLASISGSRHARFPDLSFLDAYSAHANQNSVRDIETLSDKIFRSYLDIAPFLGRLIAAKEIDPMFVITLQRDTIEIGGNAGHLSIGGLPPGVQSDTMTWVPVRGYTQDQGGLPAPLDSPGEVGCLFMNHDYLTNLRVHIDISYCMGNPNRRCLSRRELITSLQLIYFQYLTVSAR